MEQSKNGNEMNGNEQSAIVDTSAIDMILCGVPDSITEMVKRRFKYKSPTEAQVQMLEKIRQITIDATIALYKVAPECEEKKIALTKLEECLLWMTQAILRH